MNKLKPPKVSIIILNWNGKHFLDGCLDSLRRQHFNDYEIILVDNGSEDGSAEFIRQAYPEVKLIALPENRGYCVGNNLGFRESRGEYIVFLNNDTVCHEKWLEELIKGIRASRQIGFCVPKIYLMDKNNIIDAAGDAYTIAGTAYAIGHGERDGLAYNSSCKLMVAGGVSPLFRREVLERSGLFDPDFITGTEDIDLSLRVIHQGYVGAYVPTSIVYHKRRGDSIKDQKRIAFNNLVNIEIIWFKNIPWQLMLKYLPHKLTFTIGSLIYFSCKGCSFVFLRAKIKFLSLLPKVLGKRRIIMKNSKINYKEFDNLLEKNWFGNKLKRVKKSLKTEDVWSRG